MHGDGGGLWLQVSHTHSNSWIFRYTLNKQQREMGLGSFPDVSLADAREDAADQRKLLRAKIDPIESKREKEAQNKLEASNNITFQKCAEQYIGITELNGKIRNMLNNGLTRLPLTPFLSLGQKQLVK